MIVLVRCRESWELFSDPTQIPDWSSAFVVQLLKEDSQQYAD